MEPRDSGATPRWTIVTDATVLAEMFEDPADAITVLHFNSATELEESVAQLSGSLLLSDQIVPRVR